MMTPLKATTEKFPEIVDLSENIIGSGISCSNVLSLSSDNVPLAQIPKRAVTEAARGKRKCSAKRMSSSNEIHSAAEAVCSTVANHKLLKSVKLEKE